MRLDMFIASLMRPNGDLQRRLAWVRASENDLRTVRDWGRSIGLLESDATLALYRETFGLPEATAGNKLFYAMPLWPEHRFEIAVVEGRMSLNGFSLRNPEPFPPLGPLGSLGDVDHLLRIGHHTSAEVAALLGNPVRIDGWERMEDWHYSLESGFHVFFEFDFELLTAIVRHHR
jgi:hypothetical protein